MYIAEQRYVSPKQLVIPELVYVSDLGLREIVCPRDLKDSMAGAVLLSKVCL